MNEELFQKVLDNRASLSSKKKRINTEIAVSRLRTKIETLVKKGYVEDDIMNLMLEKGWLGVAEDWLQKYLRVPNLTAPKNVTEAVEGLVEHTRIPRSNYKQKHDHAENVRRKGMEALAALKEITAP